MRSEKAGRVNMQQQPVKMKIGAAAVHLFTALGAVCALFATLALIDQKWEIMFGWLGLAFLIDGIDGTFARMVDVEKRLPDFSGERLDLIVDYVTYVFVPALALLKAGYLVGPIGYILAAAMLLSSLYHFCDLGNKSDDHCFVGFPAVWNLVAFQLFAFDASQPVTGAIITLGAVLTFVPWRWVHPMRVDALWPATLAVMGLWSLAAVFTLVQGFPAGTLAKALLTLGTLWGIGLALMWRRPPEA
jgi:phosphatidylcholine synthase